MDYHLLRDINRFSGLSLLRFGSVAALASTRGEYARAFSEFGIIRGSTPPDELFERLPRSPSSERVLAALDDWLNVSLNTTVLPVLKAIDSDPYRMGVRAAVQF